jgi:hypothetical protein
MSAVGQTLTVWVPLAIRQRGGRKQVLTPGGDPCWAPARGQVDSTLVKALARAFRWRRMLEMGRYGTIAELAAAEKINSSYVSRVLRLTLLAPDIVETILDGRQPDLMTLPGLLEAPPPNGRNSVGRRTSLHGAPCEAHRQDRGERRFAPALRPHQTGHQAAAGTELLDAEERCWRAIPTTGARSS